MTSSDPTAESPLDEIAREHPGWRCWRGVSGSLYAWLQHSSPPIVVSSADPAGLREEIGRAEADLA
jgi:hypothetical protein